MKLDVESGIVIFESGRIPSGETRRGFLETPLGRKSKLRIMGGQWTNQDFSPEAGVHCTAAFEGQRLDNVSIGMTIHSDETKEWNEELELERKAFHDAWLKKELGSPPYEYSWGKVVSFYDNRACSSDITVYFGTRLIPLQWWQRKARKQQD